ncbi:PIG-H domain-containing protein [Phanerochaete sordida]|uniref:PIG-H domain-containing protein n=1 Tax=Phanerochaete sordida TaxID=48140 RepID=A0A9P3LH58_9APHY|nr:PIG-H domain-containing protein [Phanerochaete sordida]
MQHTRPLQDHPEFSIREYQGCTEYRVENWRRARDGSGGVLRFYGWSWVDAVVPVLIAVYWQTITSSRLSGALAILLAALYARSRSTQVLWESVVLIPSFGLQFETHRGLPGLPLLASRQFIPFMRLQDVVINEGLRGWNVRYYLAAIAKSQDETISLHVPFENILPYFPVLLEVYHELQENVFGRSSSSPTAQQPTERGV